MNVQYNVSLKAYNTFGVDALAKIFIIIDSEEELREALLCYPNAFIMGCGSNILLTQPLIEQPVLKMNIRGISIIAQNEHYAYVQAMAGEPWQHLIDFCLMHDLGGLENLSLIPTSVGAAPIQNIGAYGVEIKDAMSHCTALHRTTLLEQTFTAEQCELGYRDSVFKQQLKGQYIITSVCFRLTKRHHQLRTDYGDIATILAQWGVAVPSIADISKAVTSIRQSKIPNPREIGSAGSFFKNPVLTFAHFERLLAAYPSMPHYELSDGVKIPAGWLIEQAGFKGYRVGDAGIHPKQALILVNYGKATGAELLDLSKKVQQAVQLQFGVILQAEVNIL